MILPPGAGIGRLVGEVVAEIEANPVAALGEDQEVPPALGAQDHPRVICTTVRQGVQSGVQVCRQSCL